MSGDFQCLNTTPTQLSRKEFVMHTKIKSLTAIIAAALLFTTFASAQAPNAGSPQGNVMGERVEGQVKSLSGDQLTVTTSDGKTVSVTLAANVTVSEIKSMNFNDIKVGDFVGSGAKMGADGKLRAQEVHLMGGNSRGRGEGHRPMGSDASQSMTNATIVRIEKGAQGNVMVLKYPGGEQAIEVAQGTPVTTMVEVDRKSLTPGTKVIVMAKPGDAGRLTAMGVMIGSMPPMSK
jgi:hypothetical protein